MAQDVSRHPEDFPSHVARRRSVFSGLLDAGMRFITIWVFLAGYVLLAVGWLIVGVARDVDSRWIDLVVVVSAFGTLTLMVILENTARHSHLAGQMKLNALALALPAIRQEEDQRKALKELRKAIGVERHVDRRGPRE